MAYTPGLVHMPPCTGCGEDIALEDLDVTREVDVIQAVVVRTHLTCGHTWARREVMEVGE